jgi:hypothetical protein
VAELRMEFEQSLRDGLPELDDFRFVLLGHHDNIVVCASPHHRLEQPVVSSSRFSCTLVKTPSVLMLNATVGGMLVCENTNIVWAGDWCLYMV